MTNRGVSVRDLDCEWCSRHGIALALAHARWVQIAEADEMLMRKLLGDAGESQIGKPLRFAEGLLRFAVVQDAASSLLAASSGDASAR
jgi:hypothetical protein